MNLFTSSGYKNSVYLFDASDLMVPVSKAAELLGKSKEELRNMTSEELKELGCRRLEPKDADSHMSARFTDIISSMVMHKGNDITVQSGLQICDEIRELVRPFCRTINDKNIAFAEAEIDGQKEMVVMINGLDALVPGTMPPIDLPTIFKSFTEGARPRNNDSEFKFLERFAREHDSSKSEGKIALFTEQVPCEISCKNVIEQQFPGKFYPRFSLHVTATYRNQPERKADVERRTQSKRASNLGGTSA